MKKVELLSPAGNMDSLMAAIAGGCDAVYLSGKRYGARAFACNFSDEEIVEAIRLCHLYGVKVYVTINTLVYEHEVDSFLKYVDFLHRTNVDAVIIQDIGMMDLLRKTYPNLEIHASTQMHIHNLEGVKLLESLGIKRTVLARETPVELIKKIKDQTNINIEIFAHGALCISYSGQCLMSSLIGGRSGNRGTCSQVCRQPYDLIVGGKKINKNKYLLSTKDLCTLNNLDKLIDIGIDSVKIEGRMKRPEYVYLVTSIYRKAIDSYLKTGKILITDNDIKELKKIFNRNFTEGFIFGDQNETFTNTYRPNHMGIKIGTVLKYQNNKVYIKLNDSLNNQDGIRFVDNDYGMTVTNLVIKNGIAQIKTNHKIEVGSTVVKTTDYNQLRTINQLISKGRKVPINLTLKVQIGQPVELSMTDLKNRVIVRSEYIIEESINTPTSNERIVEQISKLGNSVYSLEKLDADIDDNVFVPIKVLNELRREAISLLNDQRMYKIPYKKGKYSIELKDYNRVSKKSILVRSLKHLKDKYDEIYTENPSDYTLKLPRVMECLPDINRRLLVGELGSVYKYGDIVTDFSLNVVNSYSVALLHSLGADKITLSYELSDDQIKCLVNAYHNRYHKHPNLEIIVEGYEEVMVSKYRFPDKSYLRDRFNNNYKIKIKNNMMYIYNYKKRKLTTNYHNMGVNWIRINQDI